jgi:hypothetical protein
MDDFRGYITSELSDIGIELTELQLNQAMARAGISEPDQYNWSDETVDVMAKKILVRVIPKLLLQVDITEGGYSIKHNREGILAYYTLLCAELGIPNALSPVTKPTLTNKSYLW